MKIKGRFLLALIFCFLLTGCASVKETGKKLLGTSTLALEDARMDALMQAYHCSFDECYEAVLGLGRKQMAKIYKLDERNQFLDRERFTEAVDDALDETEDEDTGFFDVFLRNRVKGHVVVMGIEGNIDTTEVGIFFSRVTTEVTRIEISSLSSSAKEKVAAKVFEELKVQFEAVE